MERADPLPTEEQDLATQRKGETLFSYGKYEEIPWTVADALEGTQIFGATGSGKTSASGATIARALLDHGFGGLVLTTKPDELETWSHYFAGTNRRLEEITVIEPPAPYPSGRIWPEAFTGKVRVANAFNLFDYEFQEGGGLTREIVSLLLNAMSTGGGGTASVSRQDPYWDHALRELLTHAVDLLVLSGRSVNLSDLMALIRSAPQSVEEANSRTWRQSRGACSQFVADADAWSRTPQAHREQLARRRDLAQTLHYWLVDFPRLNERTRTIVVSSFTGTVAGLLRSPLQELFCDARPPGGDADPTATHRGRILIVHLPVKLYGEVGRLAQVLYKTIWQRATERRIKSLDTSNDWAPVFLWADEAQYFLTPEDMQYQMTARSAFAATVYLSQNISSYYAMMGGTNPQAAVDSFLGNLQTKIFHANGDAVTNEWASRLFGQDYLPTHQHSLTSNDGTESKTLGPVVPPVEFTRLQKGGTPAYVAAARRKCGAGAYIFQPRQPRQYGPYPGCEMDDDGQPLHYSFYHLFEQPMRERP